MKFPPIYAWMNKPIWTDTSIIYTDRSPQVSPSAAETNTNYFDGSGARGIWSGSTGSPGLAQLRVVNSSSGTRRGNWRGSDSQIRVLAPLGRKVANRKNELLDKVKGERMNSELLEGQHTKCKPELRVRGDSLLITPFLCFGTFPGPPCFFLFKAHGEEAGEVRSISKIT